jgi:transcriptional regulator with XRE-family HTH domain
MVTKAQNRLLKPDIKRLVGTQVLKLRSKAGLSQQAHAEHCGFYRTYLLRIENGAANPTITVMSARAAAREVELQYFLMSRLRRSRW